MNDIKLHKIERKNGKIFLILKTIYQECPRCHVPFFLTVELGQLTETSIGCIYSYWSFTCSKCTQCMGKQISVDDVAKFIDEVGADRPPLGLRPKFIANQPRAIEIIDAMKRYVEHGKLIPLDWINELIDIYGTNGVDHDSGNF